MNMTDVFYGLGHFFQWTFTFMKGLGNKPNLFFWLTIATLIIIWLTMQARFNREAKKNNTLP
jgi:hypothetical protein